MLALAFASFAIRVAAAESAAPTAAAIPGLVEQGRVALLADKYADSLASFRKAMSSPGFNQVKPDLQYFTFMLASHAAAGLEDNLSAYEFLVIATEYDAAEAVDWHRRASFAATLDKWEDAGTSLVTLLKKWPAHLAGDRYNTWLVNASVRELGKQTQLRSLRHDLLNALFAAGYKAIYDTEPSFLWVTLATDAIDRQDLKRAREVAKRITSSSALVTLIIDRRFDALTTADRKTFDVRAAAEREAKRLKAYARANPRLLGAVVQYGYALHTLGRFDEMLDQAEAIIASVDKAPRDQPPYDDLDDNLNWIHNHKATALRALGRWEEAAAALKTWENSDRNRGDKASQAINLGFFLNELGRPDDALQAVAPVDWSKDMSPYGRTQYQFVRFQAYQQLGRQAETQEVVAWMRTHQDDSKQTAQDTLLQSGDLDGAAALLISRLRDASERSFVLAEVQTYAETPRTERQKKLDAEREAMLARADVAAAIAEFGRRGTFPIHSLEY